ncbi:MAG: hypothetical protein GX577_04880 [Leptolinea sp.]|nr:hypothetical protein [Leptolinea sp.]
MIDVTEPLIWTVFPKRKVNSAYASFVFGVVTEEIAKMGYDDAMISNESFFLDWKNMDIPWEKSYK